MVQMKKMLGALALVTLGGCAVYTDPAISYSVGYASRRANVYVSSGYTYAYPSVTYHYYQPAPVYRYAPVYRPSFRRPPNYARPWAPRHPIRPYPRYR